MKAKDLMSLDVITVRIDATAGECADIMREYLISCLPVINFDGKLVGILTSSDFGLTRRTMPRGEVFYTVLNSSANADTVEKLTEELRATAIRDVMAQPVITVKETTPVGVVVMTMMERRVNHIPVVKEDGEVVGIITRHDLLKMLAKEAVAT
ncbi:MAG: CBS domain-containing protein [SAR202 cluster bacterium]|jgi:CBS domain-containing protein|nr:CBS domain-containing protein [SAR202 cluster bacterium]MDP6511896.1 CBS domain-containing protein [SAR202 cluster bacterium]MDP6713507.1 CBS domain-containing protein [SAR202 cluster bacterium]